MTPLGSMVDGRALLQVVWVSLAAGIGLSLFFSLAIAGAARAGQQRRGGNTGAAVLWTLITVCCTMLCAVGVALAVVIMLRK